MKNKKLTKIFLFATLLLVLCSIISATDVSNDTNDNIETITTDTDNTITSTESDNVDDNRNEEKIIEEEKTIDKRYDKDSSIKTDDESSKERIWLYYNVQNGAVGDNITVHGYITNSMDNYVNEPVILIINGENYTVNCFNGFEYQYTAKVVGINNITVYYPGSDKYRSATGTKTFIVKTGDDKINTTLSLGLSGYGKPLDDYGDDVIISGQLIGLSDETDLNELNNYEIILEINGEKTPIETYGGYYYDEHGIYSFKFTPVLGLNRISVYFAGNGLYESCKNETTFTTYIRENNDTKIEFQEQKYDITYDEREYLNWYGYLYVYEDGKWSLVKNETVNLIINGKNVSKKTNKNGKFSFSITNPFIGENNISASYLGNGIYHPSNSSTTININKAYSRLYKNVFQIGDKLNIYGRLCGDVTGGDIELTKKNMTITVNGDEKIVLTDERGEFDYNYTLSEIGKHEIIVSFDGDEYYKPTSENDTFDVKMFDSVLYVSLYNSSYDDYDDYDEITDIKVGDTIKIIPKICYKNEEHSIYTSINPIITINGVDYKTNYFYEAILYEGINEYNYIDYTVTKSGINTITWNYEGNNLVNPSNITKTFYAKSNSNKKGTIININPIQDVKYSDNVTITGKAVTEANVNLKGATLSIDVNGVKYTAKTDKQGEFILTAPTKTVSTNQVTVIFAGNNNYDESESQTSFTVTKMTTEITLNSIKTTEYSDEAKIKGTYKTTSGVLLKKTTVTILVNGVKYTTKTDSKGIFILYAPTKAVGTNTVTVSYAGNARYAGATATTTFKVVPKSTMIILNSIKDTKYSDNVKIKGTYKTTSDVLLKKTTITILVNGVKYTTKTDSKGIFILYVQAKNMGKNNVSVSYAGNTKYAGATNTTTFNVVKQDLNININPVSSVKKGQTTTISGTFTDANGVSIKSTTLKLNINNKTYNVKTNSKGEFTYNYNTNMQGNNTLIASFAGNTKYNPVTSEATFVVN